MFTAESLARIIHTALVPVTATRHPLWTPTAETALIMAAAHESKMGRYLRQLIVRDGKTVPEGTARGVFQVEPATMIDNYRSFINARPALVRQIREITGCDGPDLEQLQYNPVYGAIHARLKLYRSPGEIPTDTQLIAAYLKQWYNSPDGAATANDYLLAYYSTRTA